MRLNLCAITGIFTVLASGCATPPTADPSTVDATCAQQCSGNLATCSSGFKLFPIVQQKQCNDTYDVCIKGCPPRTSGTTTSPAKQTPAERLKTLDVLYRSGAITKDEYETKRKQILESM